MRVLKIIKEMQNASQYLSMEYFIKKLSISKRTVQKEMSYLVTISKNNGFSIVQKRGKGYLLQIEDNSKFESFIDELEKTVMREISAENIAAYISINSNYTTMDEIAEYFDCSKSQVRKFKEDLEQYIDSYGMTVERKAHYGIKIKEDFERRKALISDLYIRGNEIIRKRIDNIVEESFSDIKKEILLYIKNNDYIVNDIELEKVFAYVRTSIYISLKMKTPKNSESIFCVADKIQETYETGITKDNAVRLEELIKDVSRKKNAGTNNITEDLKNDMDRFFELIDKEYNTSFGEDEDFKRLLTSHVSLLIERLRSKISYTNGIIEEILIRYPMIFNIAIRFCDMIQRKYDVEITEGEVGFVATHFCVHMEKEMYLRYSKMNRIAIACSSGGGSAYLLKMKIKTLFRNADVETFSFYNISDIENFKPDVIFSIKELKINIDVPVIIIKEILDDQDILNIRKLLMFDDINDQVSIEETPSIFIKQLFDEKYFSIEYKEDNYIKILEDMADKIEVNGIGGTGYKNYVLEREEYMPTVYMNGVSIPHPMKMSAIKNLVSIKILKNKVVYDGKDVKIIFMVSLRKENYELQKEITKGLYEIMKDIEKVKAISEAESYKQFIALIEPMI